MGLKELGAAINQKIASNFIRDSSEAGLDYRHAAVRAAQKGLIGYPDVDAYLTMLKGDITTAEETKKKQTIKEEDFNVRQQIEPMIHPSLEQAPMGPEGKPLPEGSLLENMNPRYMTGGGENLTKAKVAQETGLPSEQLNRSETYKTLPTDKDMLARLREKRMSDTVDLSAERIKIAKGNLRLRAKTLDLQQIKEINDQVNLAQQRLIDAGVLRIKLVTPEYDKFTGEPIELTEDQKNAAEYVLDTYEKASISAENAGRWVQPVMDPGVPYRYDPNSRHGGPMVPGTTPPPSGAQPPPPRVAAPAPVSQPVAAPAPIPQPAPAANPMPVQGQTKIVNGASYIKGSDGKWYKQK